MSKILENWDVASLYPNLVKLYGYSSRNQQDKKAYTDLLELRINAKHGKVSKEFLEPLNLTNDDLKVGLKLPLNAYTGTLRASFNPLYDNLQGFSICSTGQMLLLQLAYDLKQIPTLEICELNTDACMYLVEEQYIEQAHKVLQDWQDLTGLELEQDKIKKLIMRDVNNYVEIVQVGDNDYDVHYKGGVFRGKHNFKWNKDKNVFEYSFKDDLKSNSLTIVSEAVLKKLLFDKSIEKTIDECDDIFRFQMISHLGHTYEKCVQESPNGDIELQKNNRIYAGKVPRGTIVKVKPDGRRDSLANCPPNPIVDNKNELTIDDINKKWYIEYTQQMVEDFLGTGKQILKGRKKLMKKDELIAENEELKKQIEELEKTERKTVENDYVKLLKKINEFRKEVQAHEFILDRAMDSKLGGAEYSSIGQFYNFTQQTCLKLGLDFSFEPVQELRFERDIFKPSMGATRHLSTVECVATFTDIDTGCSKMYRILGSGSDSIDKSLSGAETLAFRNWFKFNFTPKEKFDWDEEGDTPTEISESKEVKVPTYIPPQVKEEVKKEVVKTEQHEDSDKDDEEKIAEMIMEIREAKNDNTYGAEVVDMLQKGLLQSAEIDAIRVKIENTYFDLGLGA